MISEVELDKIIYGIVKECEEVSPPLGGGEIEQIAVEQIEQQMRQKIKGALFRLVESGLLAGEGQSGQTQRYHVTRPLVA